MRKGEGSAECYRSFGLDRDGAIAIMFHMHDLLEGPGGNAHTGLVCP